MMGLVTDSGASLCSESALQRGEYPAKSELVEIPFLDATKGSPELLEDLQEGIWIADNYGRIVFANRALARLVGYAGPKELVGKPWRELLPVGEAARVAQLQPGTVTESSILSKDNREIPVTAALFRHTANEAVWYVGSALRTPAPRPEDTTPESASQADPARADLVATVSHDLRTPLASIKEALSLLSETAADQLDERQRRYLTIARDEIERLNRMIDNLVEVSRIDSGKNVPRLEAVDLPELLSAAVESLSLLINKRNLTIVRNVPPRLPPVTGDRDELLRVFSNILDNAIKHSPPGGTVTVDMGIVDPGATVLLEKEVPTRTGYIQVTVADAGPGIPAEFLERIFGKFERVDPHGPGIGLGLAIVRSIVEMHHGRVWTESSLGEGAKFHFVLPIKENA
jgi:PAS domain S-box-containing protein